MCRRKKKDCWLNFKRQDRPLIATGPIIEILYKKKKKVIPLRSDFVRLRAENQFMYSSNYETPSITDHLGPGKISEQPLENQNKYARNIVHCYGTIS